jgi:hypothetical protein
LVGLAKRVVKLPGKEGLRLFRFLDCLLHAIEQVTQLPPLIRNPFQRFGTFAGVAERTAGRRVLLIQIFRKPLLLLIQVTRRPAKLRHFLAKSVGGLAAKLIANFVELAASPSGLG